MSKKLHSLLEMAIVIGALIGTPTFAISAFGLIEAAVRVNQAATATIQDVTGPGAGAVEVKF
jgi:hypothetical protein